MSISAIFFGYQLWRITTNNLGGVNCLFANSRGQFAYANCFLLMQYPRAEGSRTHPPQGEVVFDPVKPPKWPILVESRIWVLGPPEWVFFYPFWGLGSWNVCFFLIYSFFCKAPAGGLWRHLQSNGDPWWSEKSGSLHLQTCLMWISLIWRISMNTQRETTFRVELFMACTVRTSSQLRTGWATRIVVSCHGVWAYEHWERYCVKCKVTHEELNCAL